MGLWDGGGRRVFSISCEVERAFSARKEAAAARVSGCEVDGGGGGGGNVDDDIFFFFFVVFSCLSTWPPRSWRVVWVALWGW